MEVLEFFSMIYFLCYQFHFLDDVFHQVFSRLIFPTVPIRMRLL